MSKTLNIDLGGQERTLLFGTIGLYDHIEKATNEEPFEWIRKFDVLITKVASKEKINYSDYKDLVILVYAGLNTHLDTVDKPNIDLDKVKKWSNGLDESQLGTVFATAISALSRGEAEAPHKNGAEKVSESLGMISEEKLTESTE